MKTHVKMLLRKMPGPRRILRSLDLLLKPPPWNPDALPERRYYSQHGQDRWVIERVFRKQKYGGYFLEIGAGDGILLSNTYVLEKDFDWNGILIEPTKAFERLRCNRRVHCEHTCIASEPKTLYVVELPAPAYIGEQKDNTLRSITVDAVSREEASRLALAEFPKDIREQLGELELQIVEQHAVTLASVLEKYNAPSTIDFFSLDVEGYEYEVLRTFPFDHYIFSCMVVERPSKPLRRILKAAGYVNVGWGEDGDIYFIHESVRASYFQAL